MAFSWPSRGHVIEPPFPSFAYRWDQTTAGQSGPAIMAFLANLLRSPQRTELHGIVHEGYQPCVRVLKHAEERSLRRIG